MRNLTFRYSPRALFLKWFKRALIHVYKLHNTSICFIPRTLTLQPHLKSHLTEMIDNIDLIQ